VTSSEVPQVTDTDLGVRGGRVSGGPLEAQAAIVLERVVGCCGELVLQRRDGHYEIVANGVFLMDTRDRGSERLHVTAAADRMPQPGRMLIGGLGVGVSLAAALAHHGVGEVDVVEREPAVLRWNRGPLAAVNGDALSDPRVHTHEADVVQWLAQAPTCALDAICLDVDNGSEWLVSPGNAWLYGDEGLGTAARVLSPEGVLTIWSATLSPALVARMKQHFMQVDVTQVPVGRGEPDVIMLGRRPRKSAVRLTGQTPPVQPRASIDHGAGSQKDLTIAE
jgi:predicted membrane-bound spermidine synthase